MELTYKQLRKREVINVANGMSLGKVNDLKLVFPSGKLVGIYVTGKKENCLSLVLKKNGLYIEESKIIKIGNDVILVNLSNHKQDDDDCSTRPDVCKKPTCPPKINPCDFPTCESLFGENQKQNSSKIDTHDY